MSTYDVQPNGVNGIIILVCGNVKIDGDVNALKYAAVRETFDLAEDTKLSRCLT